MTPWALTDQSKFFFLLSLFLVSGADVCEDEQCVLWIICEESTTSLWFFFPLFSFTFLSQCAWTKGSTIHFPDIYDQKNQNWWSSLIWFSMYLTKVLLGLWMNHCLFQKKNEWTIVGAVCTVLMNCARVALTWWQIWFHSKYTLPLETLTIPPVQKYSFQSGYKLGHADFYLPCRHCLTLHVPANFWSTLRLAMPWLQNKVRCEIPLKRLLFVELTQSDKRFQGKHSLARTNKLLNKSFVHFCRVLTRWSTASYEY
jgi:hypothetical protein